MSRPTERRLKKLEARIRPAVPALRIVRVIVAPDPAGGPPIVADTIERGMSMGGDHG